MGLTHLVVALYINVYNLDGFLLARLGVCHDCDTEVPFCCQSKPDLGTRRWAEWQAYFNPISVSPYFSVLCNQNQGSSWIKNCLIHVDACKGPHLSEFRVPAPTHGSFWFQFPRPVHSVVPLGSLRYLAIWWWGTYFKMLCVPKGHIYIRIYIYILTRSTVTRDI